MFFRLSSNENMLVHSALTLGSPKRSWRVNRLMLSMTFCIMTLTKIGLELVVSSSLIFDHLKNSRHGVIRKELAKETRSVTQSIRFVMMNCVVVCLKSFLKRLVPYAIEIAEMPVDEATESRIRTLLGTTPDNHIDYSRSI